MKAIPSLLTLDRRNISDDNIIYDLRISSALPSSIVRVIKYPCDSREIKKRQDVFVDILTNSSVSDAFCALRRALTEFERAKQLFRQSSLKIEKPFLFMSALEKYISLEERFRSLCGKSERLSEINSYCSSEEFCKRLAEHKENAEKLSEVLSGISKFNITFEGHKILREYSASPSFSDIIDESAKKLGLKKQNIFIRHLECDSSLSEGLCSLFDEAYGAAQDIIEKNKDILTYDAKNVITAVEFYTDTVELIKKAEKQGIPYTIPRISEEKKIVIKNNYDITLLPDNETIVPNDVMFDKDTPFYFLTGANGGGKTTYLRAIGVNTALFLSGAPIFAEDALIYCFKHIFTHFPKNEEFYLKGRLDDELERAKGMLERSEDESLLLFNETFSGADERHGLNLAIQMANRVTNSGNIGLFVTHFQGVAGFSYPILRPETDFVSGENLRVYKITRSSENIHAYAGDILRKYGLDKFSLEKRLKNETCHTKQ